MNPLSHVLEKCTHTVPRLGRKLLDELNECFARTQSSRTCTDHGEKRIKVSDRSCVGNMFPILLELECGNLRAPSTGFPNHGLQQSFCIVDSVIRVAPQCKGHLLSPMVLRHCDVKKEAAGYIR